jgi:hypothetical protein
VLVVGLLALVVVLLGGRRLLPAARGTGGKTQNNERDCRDEGAGHGCLRGFVVGSVVTVVSWVPKR